MLELQLRSASPAIFAAALFLILLVVMLMPEGGYGFGINLLRLPTEDKAQAACPVALLRKYFDSGDALSGFVLSMTITNSLPHLQQQLLRELHSYEGYPWTVVVTTPRDKFAATEVEWTMKEKPQCYFLMVESLEDVDFEEIIEYWKNTPNWNPLAQFVVYLASLEETEEEMTDLMVELLLTFLNKKVFNVNVIGHSEESRLFYGKTVFPYHPDNNCGNRVIAVELLDSCDYDSESEDHNDYNDDAPGIGEEEDEPEADNELENESADVADNVDLDEEAENDDENNAEKDAENYAGSEQEDDTEPEIPNDSRLNEKVPSTEEYDQSIQQDYSIESIRQARQLSHRRFDESSDDISSNISDNEDLSKDNSDDNTIPDENAPTNATLNSTNEEQPKQQLRIQEFYQAKFTDKFPRDLSGCPLAAAYRPWEPYIFNTKEEIEEMYYSEADGNTSANNTDDENYYGDSYSDTGVGFNVIDGADGANPLGGGGGDKSKLNGIEYQMVQTIGERLHVNIDIQTENANLYHLFQQLIDGEIEMIVGGIDEDPSISQFVSSSIPYHQDDLTWCVAKAKRKHRFFNFLASYKGDSLGLLLIFIVTVSMSIFMAQRITGFYMRNLHNLFSICIRMFGIILSQAINAYGLPTVLRLLFGSSFMMAFFFICSYQSLLISTLTTPLSSYQISHMSEIYSNRMTIMGSVENVRHLNKEGEIFKYIREKFQMCYNIVDCLNHAAESEHIAVAVSRQHSFYNARIQRDRLYCFDRNENLYVYLVTMLLPKKFHLLHQINPVIQHIIESGHMQKWARDLDMLRKIKEEIRRARESPFKALTLAQFNGAFAFASGLLVFASLVFALEWLIYWCVTSRRTRLKLLRCLHRRLRMP